MTRTAGAIGIRRPLLRGVSHQCAFFVSVLAGAAVIFAAQTARATVAAVIFATSVAVMFGASALYHRVNWSPVASRWMRRIDHAGIFLVIGGSYTPYTLMVLSGPVRIVVLVLVWSGVIAAIALRFAWVTGPGWLTATIAVLLGWLSLIAVPQIVDRVSPTGIALLLAGGILYTAGAIVYALKRPDPAPALFGFHEVFHALVVAAVACQYASIAFYVLPNT
jgi:hemolysin III